MLWAGLANTWRNLCRLSPLWPREGSSPFHLDLLTPHAGNAPEMEKLSEAVTVYRVATPAVDPLDLFNSVIDNNRFLVDKARELHSRTPYSLIHVHEWLTASAGIELKHDWKVPLLVTVHATERGRHRSHLPNVTSRQINQVEWHACYEAWRIIVCSSYMAAELSRYFEVPLDKVSVIPNGVDVMAIPILSGGTGAGTQFKVCA